MTKNKYFSLFLILLFTFIASVFIFREKVSTTEITGAVLLIGAIIILVFEKAG